MIYIDVALLFWVIIWGLQCKNKHHHWIVRLSFIDLQTDLLIDGKVPVSYPNKFQDAWDDMHVKMPCSEKNLFPMENEVYFTSRLSRLLTAHQWNNNYKVVLSRTLSPSFHVVPGWSAEPMGAHYFCLGNWKQKLTGYPGRYKGC